MYKYPKVKEFLDRQASRGTSDVYHTALMKLDNFLTGQGGKYNCETIIPSILAKEVDVYTLLGNFAYSLNNIVSTATVRLQTAAVRSYLSYYDVDIIPQKFKHRVKLDKVHKVKQFALDSQDIRTILNSCNSIRVKAWICILASSGVRAKRECLSIRYEDINFKTTPTSITLRADFTKTKTERVIYISDEATKFLNEWITDKKEHREYVHAGKKVTKPEIKNDDLVFKAIETDIDVENSIKSLYIALYKTFARLLDRVKMNERTDRTKGIANRKKITPHSFRRFVYTVVEEHTNTGYAEFLLGHSGSTYHRKKESENRQTYKDKCMPHLTFLDFPDIESVREEYRAKDEEKQSEIDEMQREMKDMHDKWEKFISKSQKEKTSD